jgi:anti-anti-sigma regulatory factor
MNRFGVGSCALESTRTPATRLPYGAVLRTRRSLEDYRIEISGELTGARRDRLVEALDRALEIGVARVILDLREVGAIDRPCLQAILQAYLRASDQHQQLLIVPGGNSVRAAFDALQGPFLYARS